MTIKALTYTYIPAGLDHFTECASIDRNRMTQRSLGRGRDTSILDPIKSSAVVLFTVE